MRMLVFNTIMDVSRSRGEHQNVQSREIGYMGSCAATAACSGYCQGALSGGCWVCRLQRNYCEELYGHSMERG